MSRPPIGEGGPTKAIAVVVSLKTYRKLKQLAIDSAITSSPSISAVVRKILKEALE